MNKYLLWLTIFLSIVCAGYGFFRLFHQQFAPFTTL